MRANTLALADQPQQQMLRANKPMVQTQRLTNLTNKHVGDRINVELDSRTVAIVDTVERVMAERYAKGK